MMRGGACQDSPLIPLLKRQINHKWKYLETDTVGSASRNLIAIISRFSLYNGKNDDFVE